MPVPDKELDRMVKNLQKAFNTASDNYEWCASYYGASSDSTRKCASELAAISQAYLAASREQDERLDAKDRPKLVKTVKNP